jgi:tripartite-type tricarboxylate transporter receptor subunit TctC
MTRISFFAALLFAFAAHADTWPTRALKIVVPFAPGGQPDVAARALAEPLGKALGQPVVVENRPGAGGNIAADFVAKSAPDGYTLLIGTNGPLAVSPALYAALPYDPLRDFAPVTLVGTSPNLLAVNPALGVSTLGELVARAKAQPGRLNFSSVGKGSISQLSIELLNSMAGIDMQHVPYNGGPAAVTALLANDVQVLSLNPTALIPQVLAGKLKAVAQTSAKRSPLVADIPTVAESGYAGFSADVWMAIVVPAKTPPDIVKRLNAELVKIIRSPEMKAGLWDRQWIDPAGSSPEELTRILKSESAKWAAIVKARNIPVE